MRKTAYPAPRMIFCHGIVGSVRMALNCGRESINQLLHFRLRPLHRCARLCVVRGPQGNSPKLASKRRTGRAEFEFAFSGTSRHSSSSSPARADSDGHDSSAPDGDPDTSAAVLHVLLVRSAVGNTSTLFPPQSLSARRRTSRAVSTRHRHLSRVAPPIHSRTGDSATRQISRIAHRRRSRAHDVPRPASSAHHLHITSRAEPKEDSRGENG